MRATSIDSGKFDGQEALANIRTAANKRINGATWLKACYAKSDSLSDTVRMQVNLWENSP